MNWIPWNSAIALANWVPLPGVPASEIEGAFGNPQRLGGDRRPGVIQDPHRELEPVILVAEPVGGRHRKILEKQLRRLRATDAQLLLKLAHLEPGHRLFDHERRDVARSGLDVLVGAGKDHDRVQRRCPR